MSATPEQMMRDFLKRRSNADSSGLTPDDLLTRIVAKIAESNARQSAKFAAGDMSGRNEYARGS